MNVIVTDSSSAAGVATPHRAGGPASQGRADHRRGELDVLIRPHWYAVYTCANHEKRVAAQFADRAVEHYLPQYSTVSRWKDRKVVLQRPLFPGYLFVHLELRNRLEVQRVRGVVGFVGFGGAATAVDEQEVQRVRELLGQGMRVEPHPFLTVGRRVRVKRGPLAGLEGILVRRKSGMRFVLSVELIQRSMAVEMDEADLEALSAPMAQFQISATRG